MKHPKRKNLSIEDTFKLFELFFQSGLSLAAFARQQHLPYSRLCHYKRRLLKAQLLDPQTHSLVSSQPLSISHSPSFLQILPRSSQQTDSPFLLQAGSFQLSIPERFSPTSLSSLLEVLKHHV